MIQISSIGRLKKEGKYAWIVMESKWLATFGSILLPLRLHHTIHNIYKTYNGAFTLDVKLELNKNVSGILGVTQCPKWLNMVLGDSTLESLTPSVNAPKIISSQIVSWWCKIARLSIAWALRTPTIENTTSLEMGKKWGKWKGCVLIKAINCYVNKHKGQCTYTHKGFLVLGRYTKME